MGQESSTMVDESVPPQTLKSRDLKGVADYIKSGKAKKIVIMVRVQFRTKQEHDVWRINGPKE